LEGLMDKVVHKELSYKINGLLFQVHNDLGRYKNEQQYSDYFEHLLGKNEISSTRESVLGESFPGEKKNRNKCDFIIENKIIVEMKAKKFISRDDYYQIKRYLSSSGLRLGILVNFHQKYLTPRRILNNELIST
jgi:GxxExxY protein